MAKGGFKVEFRARDLGAFRRSMSAAERRDRKLLYAFLARLERTGALSCPAADLAVAVDDTLKEKNG